jgi:hypothetical protein
MAPVYNTHTAYKGIRGEKTNPCVRTLAEMLAHINKLTTVSLCNSRHSEGENNLDLEGIYLSSFYVSTVKILAFFRYFTLVPSNFETATHVLKIFDRNTAKEE